MTTEISKPDYITGAVYNTDSMKDLKPGLYLGLFHGRKSSDEELDGWGENGPVIGPLQYVHTTYVSHIRFCPVGEPDAIDLKIREDMVEFHGMYYGDWTVFEHPGEKPSNTDDSLLNACKLALDVLTIKYEGGVGIVDAEKALHAFGNLKHAIQEASGK